MKFIHLSDLHLGKRVNEFSMLEDQAYILEKIMHVIDEEQPQAVVIAGDIYDKAVPSAEAVQLFDGFLAGLAERHLHTFVLSGNHDSAERIAFGARIMDPSGIHLSQVYDGTAAPVRLEDEYGPVCVYMLPFLKPSQVRRFYEEESIETYTDAVRVAIAHMEIDPAVRNLLVTHQFVTGAVRSDSEELSAGGADNVDVSVFDPFDYVALGHLHGPQSAGRDTVRYCGSPLKYSFSETNQKKYVTVLTLDGSGVAEIRTVPLEPRHELRELRGAYAELTLRETYEGASVDDYLRIILTDEDDVPDAIGRLRAIYPNLMKLEYDNARTRSAGAVYRAETTAQKEGTELFAELYELQNGRPMSEEQARFSAELFAKVKEELYETD